MTATTRLVGLVLAVLGVVSYLGTGRTSSTALIPAFFGVAFLLLACVARNERCAGTPCTWPWWWRWSASPARPRGSSAPTDFTRPAVLAQLVTALMLAWFLGKGISRSARRAAPAV